MYQSGLYISSLVTRAIFFSQLTFLFILPYISFCQDVLSPIPYEKKMKIEAVLSNEKIQIDGNLDEPGWQKCNVASNFIISYPTQSMKATYETEVRVMYDNVNLYIGALCHYSGKRASLQVQDLSRDFSYSENELFNIMLEPFQDIQAPVTSFCISPYSTQCDIMHYFDGSYDYRWNAVWQGKCTIKGSVWVAEIAIPFSSLRYSADSTTWGINFTRNIRNIGELSGWSLWPMSFSASRMEYGGLLVNIHPPKPNLNLRLQPYILAKSSNENNSKFQAGGEIKWAVNTQTVLEATVNTDFAQAEVDRQVINLTRSSIFFPEKRQFFLENANLFSVGQKGIIQPFFSRKIGLSDNNSIIPIDFGLRLIHQNAKQSAGILLIKQEGDSVNNPAWVSVMRYKMRIAKKVQIGIMTILRYNEKIQQKSSSVNPVFSLDGLWRISQSTYIRNLFSYSTENLMRNHGWASMTEWNYTNNFVSAGLFETIVTKGYIPQTGFLARQDFINTQPSLAFTIHKKWFPSSIAFFLPAVNADIFHTASNGAFQEATLSVSPICFILKDLSHYSISINQSWEYLTSDFSPLLNITVKSGNYIFKRFELTGQTSQSARYSLKTIVSSGGYYNGRLNSYFIGLRISPSPHIALTLNYTKNDFRKLGILQKNLTTHLFAPEMLLAVNANLQLSSIYQYNTAVNSGALNIRFSWQYRPLSFVYFVFNNSKYIEKPNTLPSLIQQNNIFKISYLKQL